MLQHQLPDIYYTAEQVRALDRTAIIAEKITEYTLMCRAGEACLALIRRILPKARRLLLLAGAGNNAGDAYVLARLAKNEGCSVDLYYLKEPASLVGAALDAANEAMASGISCQPVDELEALDGRFDLVVDGLLGTGLSGALKSDYLEVIERVNRSGLPCLAIDLPSGLNPDTGVVAEAAIIADWTLTFIGVKKGLLTGQAPDVVGELWFDDLDILPSCIERLPAPLENGGVAGFHHQHAKAIVPRRKLTDHKGRTGHVWVIGGNLGMAGAALMAAETAVRSGAGLVSVATRVEHSAMFVVRRPELMVRGMESTEGIEAHLDKASIAVVGPGLGLDHWSESLLVAVLARKLPILLDADALTLLAQLFKRRRDYVDSCLSERQVILTPHPGEAARLLDISIADVQRNRFIAAQSIAEKYKAVCLLKGAGSVICARPEESGERQFDHTLLTVGNPGMASGGMGDVLSGLIGALLAQGLPAYDAVRLGGWVHGRAADGLSQRCGQLGLLATDLIPEIRGLLNGHE